jgi:ABC-type transporter Mla maintaining outer membrane lipid asymmetry permease subunit MlaE
MINGNLQYYLVWKSNNKFKNLCKTQAALIMRRFSIHFSIRRIKKQQLFICNLQIAIILFSPLFLSFLYNYSLTNLLQYGIIISVGKVFAEEKI